MRKGTQRSFGKDVMRGSSPRVPQQDNFSDCGVYILQYVESFFEVRPWRGRGLLCASVYHAVFFLSFRFIFLKIISEQQEPLFQLDSFLPSAESNSEFPSAGEPVRVVSSAEDEDEARGDQRADPEDSSSTRTKQEGAAPSHRSTELF